MTTRFRNLYKKLTPSWLQEDDRNLFSLGLICDAFLQRTLESLQARFPERCPDDALAPMGRDRQIIRGINEPRDTFAARLIGSIDEHRVRGNAFAMLRNLRAYMGTAVKVRTVDNRGSWYTIDESGVQTYRLARGNWNWDGDTTKWARFWVIIYTSGSPWPTTPTWGDGGAWGDGRTWGSSATPEEIASLRAIVRKFKPAGTRCVNIILAFDDVSFNPSDESPSAYLPDGTWGRASKNVGGIQVPSRLGTARYIRGT